MNQYILVIEDFEMYRNPQILEESELIFAETAADAITIGGIKYRFPSEDHGNPAMNTPNLRWRRLKDIRAH